MYNAPSQKVPKRKSSKIEEGTASRGIAAIGAGTAAASGGGVNASKLFKGESQDEDDEDEIEEDAEGDPTDGALGQISRCTDNWKAAASEEKKKMWNVFDETGIFACACSLSFCLLPNPCDHFIKFVPFPQSKNLTLFRMFFFHSLVRRPRLRNRKHHS